MGWDFSRTQTFKGGNFGIYGQLKNYWSFSFQVNRQGESLSTSALRGGPSLKWPGGWGFWSNVSSDSRKKIRLNFSVGGFLTEKNDSGRKSFSLGMNFNPSNALAVSIRPSLSFSKDDMQYVSQEDFNTEKRYIFARIDQKTLGVTFRLNFSLTPDLSIQFYGQPFVSVGKYADFKNITDSKAKAYQDRFHQFTNEELIYDTDEDLYRIDENQDAIADYNFENPNFNFLQFRSNLVIRWEYKPGSALYLVWSQGRTGLTYTGDFSFNDMRNLFDIHPHNVFLIKFSYGFTL